MKRIYFDFASTTPVDPLVFRSMAPFLKEEFGNPSSLHRLGQKASAAVFLARQKIAKSLGASYFQIVFTGSATEANNLALLGAVAKWKKQNPSKKPRVVVSAIEHESVLKAAASLQEQGAEVYRIPVSKDGFLKMENLAAALSENTVLVSVMYANNEVGVVQDIVKISKVVKNFRKQTAGGKWPAEGRSRESSDVRYPLMHTDAVQAFQYLDCAVDSLGVDLLTISAHKIYGPKGIGALYVRRREAGSEAEPISPIIFGGGQEFGFRSGTESVASIVGFGAAAELAEKLKAKEAKRVAQLRDHLFGGLKKIFPRVAVNGSLKKRVPNNLSFYIKGFSAEELLVRLDMLGISASSGSACSARSLEPVKTLLEMGHGFDRAKNSMRLTLGRTTSRSEIEKLLRVFTEIKK